MFGKRSILEVVWEVLVEKMKQNVDLDEGQEKVFEELETLFRGEKEGWEELVSPYEGVEM